MLLRTLDENTIRSTISRTIRMPNSFLRYKTKKCIEKVKNNSTSGIKDKQKLYYYVWDNV
jgi:hypothetical protein